jgi:hypothetical protein
LLRRNDVANKLFQRLVRDIVAAGRERRLVVDRTGSIPALDFSATAFQISSSWASAAAAAGKASDLQIKVFWVVFLSSFFLLDMGDLDVLVDMGFARPRVCVSLHEIKADGPGRRRSRRPDTRDFSQPWVHLE